MLYHLFSLSSFELFVEAITLIKESELVPNFALKRASILQRFISQRSAVIDFARKLEQRDPCEAVNFSSRGDSRPLQSSSSQLDHDRWFSLVLSTKNVIMAQSRVLVALGVEGSAGMERNVQELAHKLFAATTEHSKTAKWQPTTHVILPCCNAVLNTSREWRAFAVANDESLSPALAPLEMWQRWLSLAGMASAGQPHTNCR